MQSQTVADAVSIWTQPMASRISRFSRTAKILVGRQAMRRNRMPGTDKNISLAVKIVHFQNMPFAFGTRMGNGRLAELASKN